MSDAAEATGAEQETKKVGKRKRGDPSYGSYIFKMNRQINQNLGMSRKAVESLNGIASQMVVQLTNQSAGISKISKKTTLSAHHVQAATRIVLPWDLAKHGVAEGTKAVAKFCA